MSLGDCPYEGFCSCRAQNLKYRLAKCKELSVRYCEGEKRKEPKSQKGYR